MVAGIASLMATSLFLSAVSDGGWAAHLRQVGTAALVLAATSGFLAVRMVAERSRLRTLGGGLAACSLVLMLLLMLCVLFRDGKYDADTAAALAVVGSVTATMTISLTWVHRSRFKWMALAPVDRSSARRRSLLEAQALNARIRHDPADANALVERSKRLRQRGEPVRALKDLDQALELDPKNAHHLLYLRHLVRLDQNDHARALQDILAAIEVDENRREDYYAAAARVYVKRGRVDDIAAMLEKQGLPASRVYAVQTAALNAALYEIDGAIAAEESAMTEKYWDGSGTRMYALRQARADILAKLREPPGIPTRIG